MVKHRAFITISLITLSILFISLPSPLPKTSWSTSLQEALILKNQGLWVYDRNQQLLRVVNDQDQPHVFSVTVKQVNPAFIQSLTCLEDRYFYSHNGVPIHGLLRALWVNLRAGTYVAGGSGLTQQVIKIFRGRSRGLLSKIKEARYALWIEQHFTKQQIIAAYFNHAHFGPNLVGLWRASQSYFSTEPQQLSLAQSAYLASLPYAPSRLSPRKNVNTAISRQRAALGCLLEHHLITKEVYSRALQEPIIITKPKATGNAMHISDSLVHGKLSHMLPHSIDLSENQSLYLSLDGNSQRAVENIVTKYVQMKDKIGLRQVAVVGLSVKTGEVLFWLGSRSYKHKDAGQVDHVLGLRLPGSTLKPFLYGLAIDRGFELDSSLPDRPIYFKTSRGQYRPQNYDHRYRGQVPLMSALAMSLNVPAVWLLNQCGTQLFLSQLRQAGLNTLNQEALHYGLGLSLGDGEVRLIDLTNAYRSLAHNGKMTPWSVLLPAQPHQLRPLEDAQKVMSPRAAQAILQVLSSHTLRKPTFGENSPLHLPFPAAVKTGTSQGYSNAWTIGLSSEFVVGVWVLPHSGAKLSGGMVAAPLWRELMLYLHQSVPAKAFDTSKLSDYDLHTLSHLKTFDSSSYRHHEPLSPDQDWSSQPAEPMTPQPSTKNINLRIVTPPEGAIYTPLPQRTSKDNQLKVEARLLGLTLQELIDLGYEIHWYWNKNLIPTDTPKLSLWIDLWASPRRNHNVCLELKHMQASGNFIIAAETCRQFTVKHPAYSVDLHKSK